jgi:hypothetical protein
MRLLRWLLLPHYLYFLSLPSLALVATAMLGGQQGVGSLCLFGLLPVAVFIALMAYCYTLPRNGWEALVYVFAVPLQIAAGCWLGGGEKWRFIAQVTAAEIGAFAVALGYVELRERPLTASRNGTPWLAVFILLLMLTNAAPFMVVAWQSATANPTPTLGVVLFVTAFETAIYLHARRLLAAARAYKSAARQDSFTQTVRLAGMEEALATTVIFIVIYLLTPMLSGFFLPVAPR